MKDRPDDAKMALGTLRIAAGIVGGSEFSTVTLLLKTLSSLKRGVCCDAEAAAVSPRETTLTTPLALAEIVAGVSTALF